MELTTHLADIAISNPYTIEVLDRFNLDYFCQGSRTLVDACAADGLDVENVVNQIRKAKWDRVSGLGKLAPGIISDIILNYYNDLEEQIIQLREVLTSLSGGCFPHEQSCINTIREYFELLSLMLEHHALSEIPLLGRHKGEVTYSSSLVYCHGHKDARSYLNGLAEEHKSMGTLIFSLRTVTSNYSMKGLQSPLIKLTSILLQQFDRDLTQRLHLENNLLFPKLFN